MMELLLLLLPVAAASGWWAARRSAGKPQDSAPLEYEATYFQGLNYLLNEQPDKAIDVFVKMLEIDSETVETHLALGNLFRRRGEVDRAIRIHQNLIARPTLTREQRAQALLELGQDYMRAGLFDRAENLFSELTEIGLFTEQALSSLRVIYQQEKDWEKSLEVARKLESHGGRTLRTEIAHYYCELAEEARRKKDFGQVANLLKKAQNADKNCVRATILQGDMEASREDWKAAIKTYKRVEQQDPAYLTEILPPLLDCYRKLDNQRDMIAYLERLQEKQNSSGAVLALADIVEKEKGEGEASKFLTEHLRANPHLDGLERLISLNLPSAGKRESETLLILQELIRQLSRNYPAYQCEQCGFSARQLHWQCPGCKAWGSVKPVQVED